METMLVIYNIEEISYGTFPLSFNLIEHYQWEYPMVMISFAQNIKQILFAEDRILQNL